MLLVGLLAPAVSAAATLSPVVWSGMPATTKGSANVRYQSFSNPAVNDAGTIAFSATVSELVTPPWYASPKAASGAQPSVVAITLPMPVPYPSPLWITNSWEGIWIITGGGTFKQVSRTGYDGYPFIVDAGGFGSLDSPVLNNSNLCAYSGSYSPGYIYFPPPLPGGPVTNFLSVYGGRGIWTSLNAPTDPVAFLGETASGYTTPLTNTTGTLARPAFASIDAISLPDTGRLVFSATVSATNYIASPGSTNPRQPRGNPPLQQGIWGEDPQGGLVTILREGEPLSFGTTNRVVGTLAPANSSNGMTRKPVLSKGSVNASGDIAVSASFTDSNRAILIASARSNSLSIGAMSGDSAPGGGTNDFFISFGDPSINSFGHVAFCGTAGFVTPHPILYAVRAAASPAITPQPTNLPAPQQTSYTNCWSALWAEDASGNVKLITRIAPPVPDMGGFTSLSNPIINSRHEVAFQGTYRQGFIRIPAGSFSGGIGVWTSRNLTNPVAWIGQTAPGYPTNFTISVESPYKWFTNMISLQSAPPVITSIDRIAFPDTGRLVVWATASETNWVKPPQAPPGTPIPKIIYNSVFSQRGIWIQNSRGILDLALREGMSVSVNGTSKVISSLPLPPTATPASGQETLCSRSNGIVVTTATFTDGTQAILRIRP